MASTQAGTAAARVPDARARSAGGSVPGPWSGRRGCRRRHGRFHLDALVSRRSAGSGRPASAGKAPRASGGRSMARLLTVSSFASRPRLHLVFLPVGLAGLCAGAVTGNLVTGSGVPVEAGRPNLPGPCDPGPGSPSQHMTTIDICHRMRYPSRARSPSGRCAVIIRSLGSVGPTVSRSAWAAWACPTSTARRRREEHRHHPRRPRRRHHPTGHRRLLRHGPQRAAAGEAARAGTATASCSA